MAQEKKERDTDVYTCGLDMIYLAACGLHGRIPEENAVATMDLAAVYHQAARHSMQAVTFAAIKAYRAAHGEAFTMDSSLYEQWRRAEAAASRKIILFELERERLLVDFEAAGIAYMPLKGVILQNCYPALGMRQMCDNDILFDPTRREDVRDIMLKHGYRIESYGFEEHDVYLKEPCYNMEMHPYLYEQVHGDTFCEYYRDIFPRLVKDEGNGFGYHFTDEDFYIFCTTHAYKHYHYAGNGVRSLMDTYCYRRQKGASLDAAYLDRELTRLGVKAFDTVAVRLSELLFGEECRALRFCPELLSEAESKILAFYIDSGTYGTQAISMDYQLQKLEEAKGDGKGAKLRYILRRLFPPRKSLRKNYPLVYRYPVLLPFFWVWRWIVKGVFGCRKVAREIKLLMRRSSRKTK